MLPKTGKKTPPYKAIGWVCSVLVVALVVYFFHFQAGVVSGFWLGLTATFAFVVLLMFALEVYRLYQAYAAGHLMPMRNATLIIVMLSVVAIPFLGIYGAATGYTIGTANMLLVPVFLWMAVRNIFYLKMDDIGLEAKLGLRAPTYVPLFEIASAEETERMIHIKTANGKDIRVFRAFFFERHWERLRERLKSLG